MADSQTPDICVIGGGASGLAVARRARALGAEVVLVEPGPLGGEALHAASIPARALGAAARRAHYLRTAGQFGMAAMEPRISARGVFDYVHEVIGGLAAAVSPEQIRAAGIRLIEARGRFVDRRTLEAGGRQIRARRFVIATGSRAPAPAIAGLKDVPYFTTASIFDNTRKLTHLVVIGGGAAGLEMAQALRRLGSAVTVVEPGALLAGHDPELAEIVTRQLAAEGVALLPHTEVTKVLPRSLGIGVAIRTGEREQVLDASHVLVAGDREPCLDGLDLEAAGVTRQAADATRLLLDGRLRTSNRRIYAVGAAARSGGGPQHVPVGHEADIVVRHALFRQAGRLDMGLIPSAAFTDPEIAEIGMSEERLSDRNSRSFRVIRLSFAENDRALTERQAYGLAKVVVGPGGKLLGAGIAGTGAAEMISLFGLAIANGMGLAHFRKFAAPYPTLAGVAEALAEAELPEIAGQAEPGWRLALGRMLP